MAGAGNLSILGTEMIGDTLFEILVYSCDQRTFEAAITAKAERQLIPSTFAPLLRVVNLAQPQQMDDMRKKMVDNQVRRQWKHVRYNELVGCIEICTVSTKIRADYWFTDKKRIIAGSKIKGIIGFQGGLFEKEYGRSTLTSREIFQDFRAALEYEVKCNPQIRRRFIDFRAFDRCGPLVDWRDALQL